MIRYILNINPKIVSNVFIESEFFLEDITINKTKCRLIFYIKHPRKQATFEDLKNTVAIAYRMRGFLFLNFNQEDQDNIYEKVIDFIKSDAYNNFNLMKRELKKTEIPFIRLKDIFNNLNRASFLLENKIVLSEKNVLKIWGIKDLPKEEKMEIEKLVSNTVKGSLSYLLIKGGKLVDSKNISAPSEELNRFVLASRLSSVLLNNFPGIHRDLKDQKVANIALQDKGGGKIILFKQLKDNYNLVFECTKSELDDAKQSIKDMDKKLERGGSKNE